MDLIDELIILIFVLQAVYSLYQRVTGSNQAEEAEQMELPSAAEDDGTWALMLARARDQLVTAARELERLAARVERLAAELAIDPASSGPLVEALDAQLRPQLIDAQRQVASLTALFSADDVDPARLIERLASADDIRQIYAHMTVVRVGLGVLGAAGRWRRDPALAALLVDAEAAANALLAPMTRFATANSGWPETPAIVLPQPSDDPDATRRLFPDRPVVFLPDDFGDERLQWPALAREVARGLIQTLPGLATQIRALLGPTDPPWLPRREGRRVVFDLQAAAGAWLPVLAVDAVWTLMLGPGALHAIRVGESRPEDPFEIVRVRAGRDRRQIGTNPPVHLRVHLIGHLLGAMGFQAEARILLRDWDQAHGSPEALIMPSMFAQSVHLPMERAMQTFGPLVEQIRSAPFAALAGRGWSSVTGFELSPGLQGRIRQRTESLANRARFQDDPRIVIAAAAALVDQRGASPRLIQQVSHAILGRGEQRDPDPNYAPGRVPRLGDPVRPREIIEAIILRAALRPVGRRRPPPGTLTRPIDPPAAPGQPGFA